MTAPLGVWALGGAASPDLVRPPSGVPVVNPSDAVFGVPTDARSSSGAEYSAGMSLTRSGTLDGTSIEGRTRSSPGCSAAVIGWPASTAGERRGPMFSSGESLVKPDLPTARRCTAGGRPVGGVLG
jgi:hypothetical protein